MCARPHKSCVFFCVASGELPPMKFAPSFLLVGLLQAIPIWVPSAGASERFDMSVPNVGTREHGKHQQNHCGEDENKLMAHHRSQTNSSSQSERSSQTRWLHIQNVTFFQQPRPTLHLCSSPCLARLPTLLHVSFGTSLLFCPGTSH